MASFVWSPFCANYLSKMATVLRSLSPEKQPKAFATYIQILSLLPEPVTEPYWRIFLRSSASDGLANLIGDAFARGAIYYRRPSDICGLIIELMFWCDSTKGDDQKAAIDIAIRQALVEKLREVMSTAEFPKLELRERMNIERLNGVLNVIGEMPGAYYLTSTREHLLSSRVEGMCGNAKCAEEPTTRCGKCKTVEYCGRECQTKHWKEEHKGRCFKMV